MKSFASIFAILIFVIAFPAYAHQIKTDNGTTVLLHTDPNDEPLSGTTTELYLSFQKTDKNFKIEECDCSIYIATYENIETIQTSGAQIKLEEAKRVMGSYNVSFLFPRHDVYAVVLEGIPKGDARFESFKIVYDLRVAHGEEIAVSSAVRSIVPERLSFLPTLVSIGITILLLSVGILIGKRFYFKR